MRVLGYKLNENKGREFSNPYQLLHARTTITMTFEVDTRTTLFCDELCVALNLDIQIWNMYLRCTR